MSRAGRDARGASDVEYDDLDGHDDADDAAGHRWQLVERAWHGLAAEYAPRAARRSASSLDRRVRRLRERAFFIVQCAISAAVAWGIAGGLLHHPQPFFAPVAALVALGQSFGQRLERVAQIVVGVAVGVLIGDLIINVLGTGYWQFALVIVLAMAAATLLDAGVLMTTQAGLQSAFVVMIVPPAGQAFSRWIDAVIGGAVALVAATITPASPLRRPRRYAATIVKDLGDVLHDTAVAVRGRRLDEAEAALGRARDTEDKLEKLSDLADDGLAVLRASPFRRSHRPGVQEIADLLRPLDLSIRNIRVLVRRATIAVREGEPVPKAYIDLVDDLAQVCQVMAHALEERRLPTEARVELVDLAERTTYVASRPGLSSEVMRAQVRSIVIDLLMVTGLSHEEALDHVPTSYSLGGPDGEAQRSPEYDDAVTRPLRRQDVDDG